MTLALLRQMVAEEPWRERAACRGLDPDMFYPERDAPGRADDIVREAKGVCRRCPVRDVCLASAIERRERYGVWGGKTERERRRLIAQDLRRPRPCERCGTSFVPRQGGLRAQVVCLECSTGRKVVAA